MGAGALALAAFLGAGLSRAAVAQEEGLVGIRLVDPQSDEERERGAIFTTIARGDDLERTIAVANATTRRVRVELYAGAARFGKDGFKFGEPGETNATSSWTTVKPTHLVLPPETEKTATVTIEVPRHTRGGKHAAVVWAELPSVSDRDVTVVNRVGVRIYLRVRGTAGPSIVDTLLWIVIGAAGVALVGGALLLLWSRRSRQEPPAPERMHPGPPPPPPVPPPPQPQPRQASRPS